MSQSANYSKSFSIIVPAKNEENALRSLIPAIRELYKSAELIIVNDGSNDNTSKISRELGAIVIDHPYSVGNGAAIKSGARKATHTVLVTMDGDGQHNPVDIIKLLNKLNDGYEMAVGARSHKSQAGIRRWIGNQLYNKIASIIVGNKIEDLTSGFRAVDAKKFKESLHLLPNGFSYPTTITMAFFRNGYPVTYVPIEAQKRLGKSHLRLFKDGLRFLIIIFKVGTLYSPLKIFTPVSGFLFLTGIFYYMYTFMSMGRFTNMSALLLISSILVFLIGLISEQITTLLYSKSQKDQ